MFLPAICILKFEEVEYTTMIANKSSTQLAAKRPYCLKCINKGIHGNITRSKQLEAARVWHTRSLDTAVVSNGVPLLPGTAFDLSFHNEAGWCWEG